MYQQFFYLVTGICMIIMTLAFCTIVYKKEFPRRRRRTRERNLPEEMDELSYRLTVTQRTADEELCKTKIEIYKMIHRTVPAISEATDKEILDKIVSLQEQLNEMQD